MTILEARKIIWQALQSDEGMRECYLANIACMLMDAQESYGGTLDFRDYYVRQAVARRIFEHMYRQDDV